LGYYANNQKDTFTAAYLELQGIALFPPLWNNFFLKESLISNKNSAV
jgi:hypothetical protein